MASVRGDGFEWDERKAAKNVRAHGITFEEGSTVYHDRNRVELYDTNHSELEE